MSKGGSSAGVDPYDAADAQLQANLTGAREGLKLTSLNQYGPTGSTTFQKDANGIPISQTVSLNAGEQGVYDKTLGTRGALSGAAQTMAGQLPTGLFQMPDNARADAVTQARFDRGKAMLDPQFAEQRNAANVNLTNRGLPVGSEIWNNEQNRLDRSQNDAYANLANDAMLAGGAESDRLLQQAMAVRNQPLNELSAMLAGASGGQMPTFQSTPTANISGGNVTDSIYRSAQMNQNQNNSMLSGLFGLGAAAMPFLFSDERVKTDIEPVGETHSGVPLYSYKYIGEEDGPTHIGVIAQEAMKTHPEAVANFGGLWAVDYSKID